MTGKPTALIAGAGFAGLTAATALAQRGWNVTVFERQAQLRASGAGIYIWENGLRILEALQENAEGLSAIWTVAALVLAAWGAGPLSVDRSILKREF